MSGVMEGPLGRSGGGSRSGVPDGRSEGGREVRWSARRKEEVVLRLLRGEGLDALGPTEAVVLSRPVPEEDRRLIEAQRKVGELAMELDSVRALTNMA
jgi:hypothetical protein